MRAGSSYVFDKQYYLGEYSGTDGAGGIDIGAKYGPGWEVVECENMLWSTGDAVLFNSFKVYGITGMPLAGNSSISTDSNYYMNTNLAVDHNQVVGDIPKGKMGDIEIFRDPCVGSLTKPVNVPPTMGSLDGYETLMHDGKPVYSKPPGGTSIHGPVLKPGPGCETFFGLTFHNIITANGDGVNEEIHLRNLCEPEKLTVYNGVGTCVYSASGTDLKWGAKDPEGSNLAAGVYYCVFSCDGQTKNWPVNVVR